MTVFKVFLNVAGKERLEVGSVALDNASPGEFESMELIQQDMESLEDAISVVFVAK